MDILKSLNITDAHSFRKWAKKGHPDKGGDSDYFKMVLNAYERFVLNNTEENIINNDDVINYQIFKRNYSYKKHQHENDFWVNRAKRFSRIKIKKCEKNETHLESKHIITFFNSENMYEYY